jgi:hypothetical protein
MTELWLACLAIATPIAGVVGFAVQIRTVRKVRLENAKLELEIKKLEHELRTGQQRIVPATPKEIEKYADVMNRIECGVIPGRALKSSSVLSAIALYAAMAATILFAVYLCFDVYRVVMWLRE